MTPWKNSSIFEDFRHWLVSPDGKRKPLRQSKQHERQVQAILQECSEGSFELKKLFDRKVLRNKWLNHFELRRKAGTVKSYLHSLRLFYKFIICEEVEKDYISECPRMIVVMENWLTVYRRKSKKDRWQKDLDDFNNLLESKDFIALDNSKLVTYCKKVLIDLKRSDQTPTFKQFTSVRDYLMIYLCIDNASRTGAVANMTCREFLKARFENNTYQVAVFNHKTVGTSGPANIVFSPILHREACIYYEKFRNHLEGINLADKQLPFFLSWSGKTMSSHMVTGQINSFWGKAVGHTEDRPRISATMIRKTAVTKTHNERPELKEDLANLMCHSEVTVRKTYFLQEKAKNVSETSTALHNLLRSDAKYDSVNQKIRQCFQEDIENRKITMKIVRDKKQLIPELESFTDMQIRDRIRYLINQQQGKSLFKN